MYHIASKDIIPNSGLRIIKPGLENTVILQPSYNNKFVGTSRRLNFLSSIDIFESLTLKSIGWLLESLQVHDFKPKELILKEGTHGDNFYIIESGVARVFSVSKGNQFERFMTTGDYFGEASLITKELKSAR